MLLYRPGPRLANPKSISIDFKEGTIIGPRFLVYFVSLSHTPTLISGNSSGCGKCGLSSAFWTLHFPLFGLQLTLVLKQAERIKIAG